VEEDRTIVQSYGLDRVFWLPCSNYTG